jgi:hypothetical protein
MRLSALDLNSGHVESVVNKVVLLALASAVILGSESRGTHDHILLSQIRDSPSLESQVPVFLSPRNRVPKLYLQALGSLLVVSYDSQSCGGDIRTRLDTGLCEVTFNFVPLITPRHGPTENTALLLSRACQFGFPRDRYSASPLARWLLPSIGCCLAVCFAVFA